MEAEQKTEQKPAPAPEEQKALVAEEIMRCTSCRKRTEAERYWVRFSCPACGKHKIIRCEKCKTMENRYICPECKFKGP